MKLFKFNVFLPFWDRTEEVFSVVGYTEEFFSTVGYNGEGFPLLWDTTEEDIFHCGIQQISLRMANIFFSIVSHKAGHFSSVVSYTTTESYAVYCIPEKSTALYPAGFLPLYPTMEDIFLHCGIQRKRFFPCGIQWKFFSVVGYNGRGFFQFWDTTEKNYTMQNEIFKF